MQYLWLRRLSTSVIALWLIIPLSVLAHAGTPDGKKTHTLKPVTHERLRKGTEDSSAWLMDSGNYQSWRFSPLKDINHQNVKKLQAAWIFQTGFPNVPGSLRTPHARSLLLRVDRLLRGHASRSPSLHGGGGNNRCIALCSPASQARAPTRPSFI